MLEKVLIPVDFSEQSSMMIDCAKELKDIGTSKVTVLHVAPKGRSPSKGEGDRLGEMKGKLEATGIEATVLVRNGDPVDTIVDEAQKESVDMIAMASGGKSRAEAFFVGSVSFGVIRRSPKPVLLDKFPEAEGGTRASRMGQHLFRHALVSVDVPMCSTNLEDLFDTLCTRGLREATLFHVIDSSKYNIGDDKRFATVKLALDKMRKKARGGECQVGAHVHFGSTAYNILEAIKEVDASVVIIGTRKMSYLRGATLGSTAEEVVRKCPIPVLVVPC